LLKGFFLIVIAKVGHVVLKVRHFGQKNSQIINKKINIANLNIT